MSRNGGRNLVHAFTLIVYPINPHQDVNKQRSFFPLKRAYMVILRWVQRQYFETIQAVLPANPLWSHGEQNVYQA
jgi:hypothetical protein